LVQTTDGGLYGTTFQGGTNNAGIVFKVNPDGSGNTPLFSFPANNIDPGGVANPSGLIQGADGALYGTLGFGGISNIGAVFKINLDGSGYTVLHSFNSSLSGPYEPTAALVQGADGYLYGTTQSGGMAGGGALFKVNTNGSGYVTLHEFGWGTDGRSPQSPLIQGLDGNLYGTTTLGGTTAQGGTSGVGTIYRIDPNGGNEIVLHNFGTATNDGQYPYTAGLVQAKDGTLYGITQQGGNSGFGTVFKINPDGSTYNIVHHFAGGPANGCYPNSALVLSTDGMLYGATEQGGSYNFGVVFRLSTDGSNYLVLYQFGSKTGDGHYPDAPLVQAADGGLFGTTEAGGEQNLGTVFRLAPAAPRISPLVMLPDKTVRLTVNAASNYTFRIDATSDHVHWVTLTNILNGSGSVQFVDSGASNVPSRFYRAAWVP
jgi:uncharacterized repeat protein (TIGR03803 family)